MHALPNETTAAACQQNTKGILGMNTKKQIGILCAIIVLAVAGFTIVLIQKNKADQQVNAVGEQAAALQTQLDDAAKNAAAELESVRAAAADAAGAAAQELENVKAEAASAASAAAQELET